MSSEHICLFYSDPAELTSVTAAFIKDGLDRGERCIHAGGEQHFAAMVRALGEQGIDAGVETARGALAMLTTAESYLREGELEPNAMLDLLRTLEARALSDGFSGARFSGDMSWALEPTRGAERALDFEARLNELAATTRMTCLCAYDRSRSPTGMVYNAFRTHPKLSLHRRPSLNPHFEPIELLLGADGENTSDELKAKRIEWWTESLAQAARAELDRERMFAHLQTLSRRLLDVQETERRHLARELHDEVGQLLTGLRLLLKPTDKLTPEAVNIRLDQARAIVDKLLERVRGLSFDLRPAALDQLGLIPTLVALFERFSEQTGVLVSFKHRGVEERASPEIETTAYRIVQEGLTNVARHAGVAGANVRVWTTEETLNLQIEDRGRGFDPESAMGSARSSGLSGMHERVLLLQGYLTIDSQPGKGTQITAELPLNRAGKKENS